MYRYLADHNTNSTASLQVNSTVDDSLFQQDEETDEPCIDRPEIEDESESEIYSTDKPVAAEKSKEKN